MPRWLSATRRPQNVCRHCGYRWYPRGHNVASQCPRCGAVAPAVASGGCCGPLVGLGVLLLLCIFASSIVGSATRGLLPASPTAISFFALATDTRNPELVPATEPPAPVLPTATPDAAAVRQRQAEGARATMVAGVLGTQTALAPTARPTAVPTAVPSARELAPYDRDGIHWRTMWVPPGTTYAELVTSATLLHQRAPTSFLNFVDDDSQYAAFVLAEIHFGEVRDRDGIAKQITACQDIAYCAQLSKNNQDAYPMPEPWYSTHYLGMVTQLRYDIRSPIVWVFTPTQSGEPVTLP